MKCFQTLLLIIIIIIINTAVAHEVAEEKSTRCGTRPSNKNDIQARTHAKEFREFLQERSSEYRNPVIQIPVCFHIPRRRRRFLFFGDNLISNRQLQNELNHLNKAFTALSCCDTKLSWCSGECSVNSGISFVMARFNRKGDIVGTTGSVSHRRACVSRPRNSDWASSDKVAMRQALYKGDESTLNVYYTILDDGYLGYATLPFDYAYWREKDGVVIDRSTIRGGSNPDYNEGDTLVHEVGHWLGLFHTFDNGCSPGDGIDDTAPEAEPYFGCFPQEQRDTCPDDDLLDPIFNFMDYSDDKCLFEFTNGQVTEMVSSYLAYRSPSLRSARMLRPIEEGLHEIGSLKAGDTQVFELNDVPMDSVVSCHVESSHDDDGNLDLFMNSHGRFNDFECTAESDEANEECSLKATSDKVYVFVHAASSVSEFTLVCDAVNDVLLE